jgi:hypothetical protein
LATAGKIVPALRAVFEGVTGANIASVSVEPLLVVRH